MQTRVGHLARSEKCQQRSFGQAIQSPRRHAAGIDVDNSTPNHLNIHVSERDYDINPRFSAFIGFVLHGYAHNNFRIFCARLRPFALNNFRFFDLSKQALHEYPSDKWPRDRRAAEQRDELAALQSIELHSMPCQPGPDCRVSNWRGSVSGSRGHF